jgi:dethiobiotin synthetase
MKKGFFITGTDTNVGKTWATVALMTYYKQHGQSVVAMKPVASGCTPDNGQMKNEDALLLQHHASMTLDYERINPYAFEAAVSPHIAGAQNPVVLSRIVEIFQQIKNQADIVLIEGVGGWYSPLNATETVSDLARVLNLPVILVVAIRLGCINHARLSYESICAGKHSCAGWIAVCTDADMPGKNENIDSIKTVLQCPLLGILPFTAVADFDLLAGHISEV